MNTVKRAQQLVLGTMLLLQLALLATGKLYIGSIVPPVLFSPPIAILAYRSMKQTGKSFPLTRQNVMAGVSFSLLAAAGFLIPYRESLRTWVALPILTDSAVIVDIAIVIAFLQAKERSVPDIR